MATTFSGGRRRSTRRESPTMGKHLKKMRRAEGGAKMFAVFRVKYYFFQFSFFLEYI
jgi:hypothetical protein